MRLPRCSVDEQRREVDASVDRELQLKEHRDKLKPDIVWNTERGLAQTPDGVGGEPEPEDPQQNNAKRMTGDVGQRADPKAVPLRYVWRKAGKRLRD